MKLIKLIIATSLTLVMIFQPVMAEGLMVSENESSHDMQHHMQQMHDAKHHATMMHESHDDHMASTHQICCEQSVHVCNSLDCSVDNCNLINIAPTINLVTTEMVDLFTFTAVSIQTDTPFATRNISPELQPPLV